MAKYSFKIENYHAIGHANLELKGITVIAGVNGCGKSTISRWLFYLINGLSSYEAMLLSDFRDQLISFFDKNAALIEDMARYAEPDTWQLFENALSLMSTVTLSRGGVDKLRYYYDREVELLKKLLSSFLKGEINVQQRERVLRILGISNVSSALTQLEEKLTGFFEEKSSVYYKYKNERPLKNLVGQINSIYKEQDSFPKNMSLKEDGVELLSEKMGKIYTMDQAIYIGVPTALALRQSDMVMLRLLKNKILHSNNEFSMSSKAESLTSLIENMISGTVVEKENLSSVDLMYRNKLGQDIKLEDIASGYKPLVYMLRLIKNGWLTENTLLEIDEPETNLHPSWVVEFAHLLVLVHKYFGTKILVASHHPDMVSAIKYIAEKEGVLENTNFYLAEQANNTVTFDYRDLNADIEPVFESFNQSFDTLQRYTDNYGEL